MENFEKSQITNGAKEFRRQLIQKEIRDALASIGTEKTIIGPNQYVVLKPHMPHLFYFLEDTVMIEWWDGPFEAWFYKSYRDIIDQQFEENIKKIKEAS